MVINISIHDSVKKNINAFEFNYLCSRRFSQAMIKKILTDQNECTLMRIDFEWQKEDENKYAQIKTR